MWCEPHYKQSENTEQLKNTVQLLGVRVAMVIKCNLWGDKIRTILPGIWQLKIDFDGVLYGAHSKCQTFRDIQICFG